MYLMKYYFKNSLTLVSLNYEPGLQLSFVYSTLINQTVKWED